MMRIYEEYNTCEGGSSQTTTGDGVFAMEGIEFEPENDILAHMMQEKMKEQYDMISNEVDKYLADRYVYSLTKRFDINCK